MVIHETVCYYEDAYCFFNKLGWVQCKITINVLFLFRVFGMLDYSSCSLDLDFKVIHIWGCFMLLCLKFRVFWMSKILVIIIYIAAEAVRKWELNDDMAHLFNRPINFKINPNHLKYKSKFIYWSTIYSQVHMFAFWHVFYFVFMWISTTLTLRLCSQ